MKEYKIRYIVRNYSQLEVQSSLVVGPCESSSLYSPHLTRIMRITCLVSFLVILGVVSAAPLLGK